MPVSTPPRLRERVTYTRSHRAAAWGVHLYTALGLPIAFYATFALFSGNAAAFFVALCIAVFVDATDGTMARRIGVRDVTPGFDGRRLDDIVDFIVFAFLPAVSLPVLGLLPTGWEWAACAPLMASGYGFCQERAKTEDAFVGFPSYWNIGVLYFYLLQTDPWLNLATVLAFSVLVFVPIHFVYPTKTALLRPITLYGGFLWGFTLMWLSFHVGEAWTRQIALATTIYPLYYLVISGVHHVRTRRALRDE